MQRCPAGLDRYPNDTPSPENSSQQFLLNSRPSIIEGATLICRAQSLHLSGLSELYSHSFSASVAALWVISSVRAGVIGAKCNLLFFALCKSLTKKLRQVPEYARGSRDTSRRR